MLGSREVTRPLACQAETDSIAVIWLISYVDEPPRPPQTQNSIIMIVEQVADANQTRRLLTYLGSWARIVIGILLCFWLELNIHPDVRSMVINFS